MQVVNSLKETSEDPPACVCDDNLEHVEASLTRDVPSLLEAMNSSSAEVNSLESEAASAQQQYQRLLLEWTSLTEDMRLKHGQSFDSVRPYFDAVHRARTASQRAQGIVRTFSAASSQCTQAKLDLRKIENELAYGAHNVSLDSEQQEGLSRATVRALKSQQERDKCEAEYAKVLKEYQDAKTDLEKCRATVGEAQIRRMMPCFQQLQNRQHHLAEKQKRVSVLQERIRVAKNAYHQSMRGLDRISTAVHNARKEHAKEAKKHTEDEGLNGDTHQPQALEECCPEKDHPEAESAVDFAFGDSSKEVGPSVHVEATPEVTASTNASAIDESPFS